MRAVLHLIDTLEPGGAETVAVDLVNHLSRERFRPFLGTTRREGPLAERILPDVGRLSLGRRRSFDPVALGRLSGFIRRHGISIVHAHSTSLFTAILATFIQPEVRVVWHDHFGRHGQEERPVWLYGPVVRRAAGVIAVNEALARWSREQLGAERVWYLPNFATDIAPGPVPELPGEPGRRIVCVANLREQKDHPTLLAAMARVVREEPAAHLLLVGAEVEPGVAARVMEMRRTLGLENCVSLLGRRDDVPALLSGCGVGVLSSSAEGFPLALLEYGTAGLPAVATRVGQCAELLDEGDAGILVPPGDPGRLAEALLSLLRSPELRGALGARLRERVRSRYSAAAAMEKLERVYHALLSPRSGETGT